jgi:hypothetical protein
VHCKHTARTDGKSRQRRGHKAEHLPLHDQSALTAPLPIKPTVVSDFRPVKAIVGLLLVKVSGGQLAQDASFSVKVYCNQRRGRARLSRST